MVIAFGITAIYFDQPPNSSQPISGIREDLSWLGTGALAVGPLSIPILVAVAGTAAVLMWVLLSRTVFGKNVYAIGGNPQAAQVSGVNIVRTLIAVYAIAGACSHRGGPLGEGALEGSVVTCPWHGARFEVTTGAVLSPPAPRSMATYRVIVEDDAIMVDLP